MPPSSGDAVALGSRLPSSALRGWLARLLPGPVGIDGRETWRTVVGATLGILFAAVFSRMLAGAGTAGPWLVAPLGASAVLVFAVPASPLAQPWAVVAGNTLSALVGVACVHLVPDPVLASGLAVGLAMLLMVQTRCLHPPGGAAALLMVVSHTTQFHVAVFPVLFNSLLLVLMGVLYNSLTGRPYPRAQVLPAQGLQPVHGRGFTAGDLDAALAHYNQVVDISRADLQSLLEHAEMAAYQRKLGAMRCGEVMSRAPVSVQFGTPLQEAWDLMRSAASRPCRWSTGPRASRGSSPRRTSCASPNWSGTKASASACGSCCGHGPDPPERPEVVGQIMTRQVRVASEDRLLADLVPVFAVDGHHHIPVIDAEQRLAGMITQTDLVQALYRP